MPYPALLALHLVAVAVFVAGLLLTGLALPALARAPNLAEIARLQALNRWGVTPALALVWACGIAMAVEAGWYAMGWVWAKAVVVALLSALHGRQMRGLRMLRGDRPPAIGHRIVVAEVGLVVVAIALVVSKAF